MAKKKAAVKTRKKLVRILSIDGGGIRGILPGQIVVKLEEILQKKDHNPDARIADYFDMVAGTSTGGILACLYLCPDDTERSIPRPKLSALDAVDIYLERGDEIFDVSFWEKVKSSNGLLDEMYGSEDLEDALKDYLGDVKLSQLLKPCLITAYDIKRRMPFFFRQHRAVEKKSHDFYLRDVGRSTSAAPTYFEPARIKSMTRVTYPLIDGGVFANNPAMCVYAEARAEEFGPDRPKHARASEMLILSLGTGVIRTPYPYRKAKNWGKAGWILPMIDILMTGNSDTVHHQLEHIFDSVDVPHQYVRIEPQLVDATPEMDDASSENLNALREAGTESAQIHENELEDFADLLIANK